MATRKAKVAVALFQNADAARKAVEELVKAGFRKNMIGMVSHDGKVEGPTAEETGSKWEEGAAVGVAAGAGAGALWALGIAAGLLPGIGPVIAGGLLASVLASAAGTAAIAGVVGALIGLGIPEEEAKYYESEIKAGRTLVTVKSNTRYDEAVQILSRNGGYTRPHAGEATASTTTAAASMPTTTKATTPSAPVAEETQAMEVRHEEARPRKTSRKKGEVRVRKEVVTDMETLEVPVEREEVVIERRPVHRKAGAVVQEGEEIRIPVKEEEVRVEKEVVVDEEVAVGKRKVRDTKKVTTPVRHEEVKIEQEGETDLRETDTPRRTR